MLETAALIRSYIEAMGSGSEGLTRARRLLADDLDYSDPLLVVADADDLMRQVEALGDAGGPAEIITLVAERDQAAALTAFPGPGGEKVLFSQWFLIAEGRIRSINVIYDPRAFLAAEPPAERDLP